MTRPLSEYLHEAMCDRVRPCPWYTNPEGPHRDFYDERARMIMSKLEPEIGEANVIVAVRVIVEELW